MTMPKIRFLWNVNLGAVLQMMAVMGAALTLYGVGLKFQFDTEKGLAEGAAARTKYIPIIEALEDSDRDQDKRLDNMTEAIQELRKLTIQNTQKLGDMATDIAVIKDRLPERKSELNRDLIIK